MRLQSPAAWSSVLLFTAAVLAGCAAEPPPTTITDTPPAGLPNAGASTAYHTLNASTIDLDVLVGNNTAFLATGGYNGIGTYTFEPTIGATSSGAIFVTSIKRELGTPPDLGTHIIRGRSNGTEWQDMGPFLGPVPVTRTLNSNDPYLYVDPWTDRIYDFDMCGTLSAFCVSYSDDDGESWLTVSAATGESTALDHQSLASAPAVEGVQTVGYPNVLVFCVNRGPQGGAVGGPWCSTSRDGGINWTPLLPGFPLDQEPCSGLHGHLKGAADGTFYRGNPSCDGAAVYRSVDAGVTWTEHTIPGSDVADFSHDIEVAVDEGGILYAFWIGKDGLPYLAYSPDRGDTWSAPAIVSAPDVTATGFPAITAGAKGRIAFAYVGTTIEKGYKGSQSKATWNGYIGVMTDATALEPLITTVAVNDPAADPLSTGECGDTRCGGFGDFIDITMDPWGRPWAAFANNEEGEAGLVGTLVEGPALKGELKALPKIVLGGPASLVS